MNILLHICCAPCAIFPIEEIKGRGHQVRGIFYNPNIHPKEEYLMRRQEVEKYCAGERLEVAYPEYEMSEYTLRIAQDRATNIRCPSCWRLRLEFSGRYALENGFDAFTTTLLGSPYQDLDTIKRIGDDVAKDLGVGFYYGDFRSGFRAAHEKARAMGIYCQRYCGCGISKEEALNRSKIKDQIQKIKAA